MFRTGHTVSPTGTAHRPPLTGRLVKTGQRLAAMQRAADASTRVLQLKKLDPAKLNVAGEVHTETEARADKEKAFAREKAGGHYWSEQEFRLTEELDTDGVNLPEVVIQGDPKELVSEGVAALMKSFNIKSRAKDGNWLPFLTTYTGRVRNWHTQARGHVTATSAISGPDPHRLKAVNDVGDLVALMERLLDEAKAREALRPEKKRLSLFGGFKNEPAKGDRDQLARLIKVAAESTRAHVLQTDQLRSWELVTRLRSDKMHEAAVFGQRKNVKGVWKVGDAHVTDIARDHADEVNYQLLSVDEFDAEYGTWEKATSTDDTKGETKE